MRRLPTAVLAVLLTALSRSDLTAQSAQPFVIRGCVTGLTGFTGFQGNLGTIACFDGTARLTLEPPVSSGISFYRLVGDLTASYGSDFAGTDLRLDVAPTVTLTTGDGRAVDGTPQGLYRFAPGTTNAFTALLPTSVLDSPGAFKMGTFSLALTYGLSAPPPVTGPYSAGGRLQLTAAPEPGSLALAAAGFALVGAGAWRRRRA